MTACTEPHPAEPDNGIAGEGQKGMTKGGPVMTACTEPHPPQANAGAAREGQKGMTTEVQP
jgi:hypothetical protein